MFRLAHELKRQVHELMGWTGPLTHRQYLGWQAWLEIEWDRPSRSDWYAMQVAAETRRGSYMQAGISADQVREINMKLVFKPAASVNKDDMTDEQFQEWEMNVSKSLALARRGKVVQEAPMESDVEGGLIEEQPDWTYRG